MTMQASEVVEQTELFFTIIYTTEMGFKILARGFLLEKFTYLRDAWNWLDFAVIIMAYMTIVIEDLGNLSVIRTFRVLRALKTVAIIPGMKTIVGAVIDSVKNLKDVVVLTLFSLSVFALLGLQIYMGMLTQKCILNGPTNQTNSQWHEWSSNSSNWLPDMNYLNVGNSYQLCGNASGASPCPENYTCLQGFGLNPDYGFTNFDTFGWALICSFRLMTQDFWEGLYKQVLKTAGSSHIIFFLFSIFLGSIYLMNLILAIVAMSYNELQKRAEQEDLEAAEDEAEMMESFRLFEIANAEAEAQEEAEMALAAEMEMAANEGTHSLDPADRDRCTCKQNANDSRRQSAKSNRSANSSSYRPSLEIGLLGRALAAVCQSRLQLDLDNCNTDGGNQIEGVASSTIIMQRSPRSQSLSATPKVAQQEQQPQQCSHALCLRANKQASATQSTSQLNRSPSSSIQDTNTSVTTAIDKHSHGTGSGFITRSKSCKQTALSMLELRNKQHNVANLGSSSSRPLPVHFHSHAQSHVNVDARNCEQQQQQCGIESGSNHLLGPHWSSATKLQPSPTFRIVSIFLHPT